MYNRDSYLRRMMARRDAAERASPGARADPVLAEFLQRNPRPTDPIALQVWNHELDAYRKERQSAAVA